MAIRPMPTPSAEPYATYSTEKNKKKKQTNSTYVTNTVTQPPQPAPVVPSALPVTNNTQTLPKQNTASQTKSNLSNTASYNPLSLKQNSTGSQSAMDTIYNKTVTYDAVPTPQIQHGSYKSPVQKSYSYTETKPTANTGTAVKANITADKTAYNPYVTKDRVENGQNGYSVLPKLQENSNYTDIQRKKAIDELWAKYGARLMGKDDKEQMQKPAEITEPQSPKVQTVKAGKSTINIRDDGSTIHYESDTAIDLFDFLDFLSGRYGPNNEMAGSVNRKSPVYKQPVLDYEDFISVPDTEYIKDEDYWENRASDLVFLDIILNKWKKIKAAEAEESLTNLPLYKKSYSKMVEAKESATETRNMLFGKKGYGYSEYGLNLDGGKPNAFLHIYLAANMTDILGENEAREFLTAHETYTRPQYYNNILYSQPDIPENEYDTNKKYPTVLHHTAMDLHNNDLGIYIAKNTPTDDEGIIKELISILGQGETLESLREQFPNHTDRQILFIKKAQKMVEYDLNNEIEAAIIWDELI